MRTNAFFQKKKVWLFTVFSFILSNTGIGSSCYSETEEEDEAPSQQILLTKEKDRTSSQQTRIRNTSRRRMYGRKILIKEEKKVPSQQILLTKEEDGALSQQVYNTLCQKKNGKMLIKEEKNVPSQQILLTKEEDEALSQQVCNTLCQKKNGNRWTKKEDERLLRKMSSTLKKPNGKPDWQKISESCPNKSWQQCKKHWEDALNPSIKKGPWDKEEDRKLSNAVGRYLDPDHPNKRLPWAKIAKEVPGRIGKQCQNRWQCISNPNVRKGSWDKEEDEILIRLVGDAIKNNNNNNQIPWADVAKLPLNRTAEQCRSHWVCVLDPNIKRGPWTDTETEELMKIVKNYIKEHGNRKINWQVIAQSLAKKTDEVDEINSEPYRTGVQCCNRWKCLLFLDLSRKPWTKKEDKILKKQLQNPPCDNRNRIQWTKIADESIPGRTPDQCRSHARGQKFNIKD
jgi:myb proto-oncogene protein